MKLREILTWKFLLYQIALPVLRRLGARRADALLKGVARLSAAIHPGQWQRIKRALRDIGSSPDRALEVAAGKLRFLGRDYLLEGCSSDEALRLFDVEGEQALLDALAEGQGAVLVGSHYGAHISALHWFYQRKLSLRLMVQRPKHITNRLAGFFDASADEPDPQSAFFLRRGLPSSDCVKRLLMARNALKRGKTVYLAGDVPWQGGNTRFGRFLGRPFQVLSVWADLAAVTKAPVFVVFCSHREGGGFSLRIEPFGKVRPGTESTAIARYLERLDREIVGNPGDASAHLLWPCFGISSASQAMGRGAYRPSRKAAPTPLPIP